MAFLTLINGCTAVGFGIGAMTDEAGGKGPPSRLAGVRSGVEITMWLTDGRKLHGVYRGNRASSGEAASSAPAGVDLPGPPPGAVILLETKKVVQEIPASTVYRVSVPVAHGKVIGGLIGLVLDAAIVLAVNAGLQ